MFRKTLFTLVTLASIASLAGAALAEDNGSGGGPPSCPGGTVKGTFHCTGPIGHQTCTEGAPWTCTLDKAHDPATLSTGGGTVGPNRGTRFNGIKGVNSGLMQATPSGGGAKPKPGGGVQVFTNGNAIHKSR